VQSAGLGLPSIRAYCRSRPTRGTCRRRDKSGSEPR
jgi:hypothetical protein